MFQQKTNKLLLNLTVNIISIETTSVMLRFIKLCSPLFRQPCFDLMTVPFHLSNLRCFSDRADKSEIYKETIMYANKIIVFSCCS